MKSNYSDKEKQLALDKAKTAAFMGSHSAFLGTLLCSINTHWVSHPLDSDPNKVDDPTKTLTASVCGNTMYINDEFFMRLTTNQRRMVLLHELWHIANLHDLRLGNRDLKRFQIAADYEVNDMLHSDGYNVEELSGLLYEPEFHKKSAEEIYELLPEQPNDNSSSSTGSSSSNAGNQSPSNSNGNDTDSPNVQQSLQQDLKNARTQTKEQQREQIEAVTKAVQAAKMAGEIPGNLEKLVNKFVAAKVPWERILNQFFTDTLEKDYTWKRPNKKFEDIYLPSLQAQQNRLGHLMFFLDTSGSIEDEQLLRFNSELHYIKEVFQPEKMTVVQFDYVIQEIKVFGEDEPYENIKLLGGGGTNYTEVGMLIKKERPQAAVIFTDLCATPMEPITNIPIFWIVSGVDPDYFTEGSCGKTINID